MGGNSSFFTMSEMQDDISLSSDIEDDSVSNLFIDQINITEITDYIAMNCHESTTLLRGLLNLCFYCQSTTKNMRTKIFYNILTQKNINRPKKEEHWQV